MTLKKIGLLIGGEWSWPPAFIEEVNQRNAGVVADLVKLGGTQMAEPCEYDIIIDRVSHEVPYYRTFLKTALLAGTIIINNPFWASADDRFFGATLTSRLGIPHPRTVALPSHSYKESVHHSLSNLIYPIPWEEHVNYLGGFPIILMPVWNTDYKKSYILHSLEDLWRCYNQTGTECMMLQERLPWHKYVRCLCIGQEYTIVIRCDPNSESPHRYCQDDNYLTATENRQVVEHALKISHALGYDMHALEFGLNDGTWYATDLTNPVPDFEVNSITPYYFEWVVKTMATFTIDLVKSRKSPLRDFAWNRLLNSTHRPMATTEKKATPTIRKKSSSERRVTTRRRRPQDTE